MLRLDHLHLIKITVITDGTEEKQSIVVVMVSLHSNGNPNEDTLSLQATPSHQASSTNRTFSTVTSEPS